MGKGFAGRGVVAAPPELKATSWQSGETACGRVTRPLEISMGASNGPAVCHMGESFSVISFSHRRREIAPACGRQARNDHHWRTLVP